MELFEKAEETKEVSETANIREQIQLDIYEKQLEQPVGSITKTQFKTILEKYFIDVPETIPDDLSTLTLTTKSEYGNYSIKVSDIYDGTISGNETPTYIAYNVGDEVTVGGEQFYILEWDNDNDTVNLISKYKLNSGGTAQQDASSAVTVCTFSSTNYWSSSFTSDPFNLNDFIGFTSTDALGKAKSYGISKGAVSSRLLSYEEANELNTKASSDTKIRTMLWGKDSMYGSLIYWLGSARSTSNVWYFNGYNGTVSSSIYSDNYSHLSRGAPSYRNL